MDQRTVDSENGASGAEIPTAGAISATPQSAAKPVIKTVDQRLLVKSYDIRRPGRPGCRICGCYSSKCLFWVIKLGVEIPQIGIECCEEHECNLLAEFCVFREYLMIYNKIPVGFCRDTSIPVVVPRLDGSTSPADLKNFSGIGFTNTGEITIMCLFDDSEGRTISKHVPMELFLKANTDDDVKIAVTAALQKLFRQFSLEAAMHIRIHKLKVDGIPEISRFVRKVESFKAATQLVLKNYR